MTLPTSGAIDLARIGYEANKPLMSTVDINNTEVRKLPNIAGKKNDKAPISFSDFYGATFGVGIGYGATEFVDNLSAPLSTNTYSNLIYLYNISSTPISMVIASSVVAYFRINGGAWQGQATIGSIQDGDSLEVYVASSAVLNTNCSVVCTFSGGATKTWNCWTVQGTGTASFTAVSGSLLNTAKTSNVVKITDAGSTPVAVSCAEATMTINNLSGITTIKNNDIISLQMTSSSSYSTTKTANVLYGTSSKTWNVTTGAVVDYFFKLEFARGPSGNTSITLKTSGIGGPANATYTPGSYWTYITLPVNYGTGSYILKISAISVAGGWLNINGYNAADQDRYITGISPAVTVDGASYSRVRLTALNGAIGFALLT